MGNMAFDLKNSNSNVLKKTQIPFNHKMKIPFWGYRSAIWTFIFASLLTVAFFRQIHQWEQKQIRTEFKKYCEAHVAALRQTILTSAETLTAIQSFYGASLFVDRAEFEVFVKQFFARHPAIHFLEWIPRVAHDQRPSFVTTARAEGLSDFEILIKDSEGDFVVLGEKMEYFPLYYSLSSNHASQKGRFGYDYSENPERWEVMRKAADEGRFAATVLEPISRFDDTDYSPYGFIVFAPVYDHTKTQTSLQERRDTLQGFVSVVFNIESLMKLGMNQAPHADISHTVSVRTASGGQIRVFRMPEETPKDLQKTRDGFLRHEEILEIFGQEWLLQHDALPDFFVRHNYWQSPVDKTVLAIGILLSLLFSVHMLLFENHRQKIAVQRLSMTDPLTGLYNRRGFIILAQQQMKLSRRNQKGFWLFMLDLDHFKKINDRFGHAQGDHGLQMAAHALTETFRRSDIVARIGGDEFAVIAIDADEKNLEFFLKKIKDNFEKENLNDQQTFKLTASTGYSYFDPAKPEDLDALLKTADVEMYRHKNKVML